MYQSNFESERMDSSEFDYLRKRQMETTRSNALDKLFTLSPHLSQVENLAAILSYAHKEQLQEAINIADALDLTQLDFFALDENLDEFCKEFEALQFSRHGDY